MTLILALLIILGGPFLLTIFCFYISYKIGIKDKITITYKQFMALYAANPDAWSESSIYDFAHYDYNFIIYKSHKPRKDNARTCYDYDYIHKSIYFSSWFDKLRAKAYFKKEVTNRKKEQLLKEKAELIEYWNNDVEIAYKRANETLEKAKKQYQEILERMEKEDK